MPPQIRRSTAAEPNVSPKMTSLTGALTRVAAEYSVLFNWSSANADYIQLQYPCVKDLLVSISGVGPGDLGILKYGPEIGCGVPSDRNLPPSGSATLLIDNLTGHAVRLAIQAVPFSHGASSSSGAKEIDLNIPQKQKPNNPRPRLP